jgi:uncharacterized membrane protein YfcA
MAAIMLVKPSVVAPPIGTPTYTLKDRPIAWVGLFMGGIYGGFVQAGIGFVFIVVLAGTLRYDLVRTNALKMAITAALTLVALTVFIVRKQVLIIPGLVLAIGMVLGALASVQFAINVKQDVLKWIMFIMVILVCLQAYFS